MTATVINLAAERTRRTEQAASRSPEIAHSCSHRLKEPHRIDEPGQFCCSDGNSTLGCVDLRWRDTGCNLKFVDAIDRGV